MEVLVLLVVCVVNVIAYPNGAPGAQCGTMTPNHGANPQQGAAPYTITATKEDGTAIPQDYVYTPGEKFKVTITPDNGVNFKGFLLKARKTDANDQAAGIGTFTTANANVKKVDCSGGAGEGMTHVDARTTTFTAPIEFEYTAPSPRNGNLEFVATVVQQVDTFWVQIKSTAAVLNDPDAVEVAGPDITIGADPLNLEACTRNTAMGCFTYPSKCTSDCDLAVTWMAAATGSGYNFEMSSKQDYVALGFSTDESMGDDLVIDCIRNKDASSEFPVQAGNSINNGRSNSPLSPYTDTAVFSNQVSGFADGEVRCRFTHTGMIDGKDITDKAFSMFLAGGETTGNTKKKHSKTPFISARAWKLSEFEFVGGKESKPILLKLHGAFMIVAWVVCASIGIMMARYYKEAWPTDYFLCGKNVWFTVHRLLMVTVFTLTLIAFAIIFIHVKGYSELTDMDPTILSWHPITGIIVTALAIINPVMAVFRPHPGTENRVIFNWAHWAVGTLAHSIGVITVFLGIRLPAVEAIAPDYLLWIMIAVVAFHVLTALILELHKCSISRERDESLIPTTGNINNGYNGGGGNQMEMQQPGQHQKSPQPNGSGFKKAVLVIYVLVILGLGLTLAFTILTK